MILLSNNWDVRNLKSMNKSLALDSAIARLCPEFSGGGWSIADKHLAGLVKETVSSSSINFDQLPYIAELICLDNYLSSGRADDISQYITRFALEYFAHSDEKRDAIASLCDDAIKNTNAEGGVELERLLLRQPIRAVQFQSLNSDELRCAKETKSMLRIGDTTFIPTNAEVFVIGDTHADHSSTKYIINQIKQSGAMETGAFVVFLGDYSNNGVKSVENLISILELREAYPHTVVLLNGNHEFKESYQTALKQFLSVHWDRFRQDQLPERLKNRQPQLNNHYGHLRLELVRKFGFERGEHLYDLCSSWGRSLPCICISGDLMISHSLGMNLGDSFTLSNIINAKHNNIDDLHALGYEAWSASRNSQHAQLVNNRVFTTELVHAYCQLFEVTQFVVGHCHYRSGDTKCIGKGVVTTITSSHPYSPDSGHYMYQQMHVARNNNRRAEDLTNGDGVPGYLHFHLDGSQCRMMTLLRLKDVYGA